MFVPKRERERILSGPVGSIDVSVFPVYDGPHYREHLTDYPNFYCDVVSRLPAAASS